MSLNKQTTDYIFAKWFHICNMEKHEVIKSIFELIKDFSTIHVCGVCNKTTG